MLEQQQVFFPVCLETIVVLRFFFFFFFFSAVVALPNRSPSGSHGATFGD
jgi:hypothetical protein